MDFLQLLSHQLGFSHCTLGSGLSFHDVRLVSLCITLVRSTPFLSIGDNGGSIRAVLI